MLSQAVLDSMADVAFAAYGTLIEDVTYHARSSATAVAVAHTVRLHLGAYRQSEIDLEVILRDDQRALVRTHSVTFTPTPYDEFVRANGSRWRVVSVTQGTGFSFWVLQVRRVA